MTEAQNFAERCKEIMSLDPAQMADLLAKLANDIDAETFDWRNQPDGSVIYELRDFSYLRVCGIEMTEVTADDFGETTRKHGRLTL